MKGFQFLSSCILLCALLVSSGCGRKHPSDAELTHFVTNKFTILSNIVVVLQSTPEVKRVDWMGQGMLINNYPVAAESHHELQNLCAALDHRTMIVKHGNGTQIQFFLSTRGLSVSGSAKGIMYQEHTPHILVMDTDKERPDHRSYTVFREVRTNWYLFYSQ